MITYIVIGLALAVTAWVLISDADSDIEPEETFDNWYNNHRPHN